MQAEVPHKRPKTQHTRADPATSPANQSSSTRWAGEHAEPVGTGAAPVRVVEDPFLLMARQAADRERSAGASTHSADAPLSVGLAAAHAGGVTGAAKAAVQRNVVQHPDWGRIVVRKFHSVRVRGRRRSPGEGSPEGLETIELKTEFDVGGDPACRLTEWLTVDTVLAPRNNRARSLDDFGTEACLEVFQEYGRLRRS